MKGKAVEGKHEEQKQEILKLAQVILQALQAKGLSAFLAVDPTDCACAD